jgi:chloramphenicol 3-O phosphotransferase
VHCPLEILRERERSRGDRPTGSAQRDFETIHLEKLYDIDLDTRDGVDVNVERILAGWRSAQRSSSFSEHKLRAKIV